MIFRKSTLFDFFNGLWEYNGLTELAACKSFLSYDSAAGWQDYLFYFPVALITAIININIFSGIAATCLFLCILASCAVNVR